MNISIALATYNGEAFLADQLKSFVSQSRPPDEIVVSDDGSKDGTLKILEKFCSETNIFVKIIENDTGRGVAKNFNNALRYTTGDLILLADQDDIWFPNKLKVYEKFFVENPSVHLMLTDAAIFQENINVTERTKLDYFRDRKYGLDNFCTGCCMGFRRSFLELSMPIPSEGYAHDVWLSDVGSILESKVIVDEVTMYYRRHGANVSDHISSSINKVSRYAELSLLIKNRRKTKSVRSTNKHSEILLDHFEKLRLDRPDMLDNFDDIIGKLRVEFKEDIDRNRRINKTFMVRAWLSLRVYVKGGYRRYSGLRSLIKDIFF